MSVSSSPSVPRGQEVADASERVAAILEPADELEAAAGARAVDADPPPPFGRGQQADRLVLADRAGGHPGRGASSSMVSSSVSGRGSERSHLDSTVITVTVNTVTMTDRLSALSTASSGCCAGDRRRCWITTTARRRCPAGVLGRACALPPGRRSARWAGPLVARGHARRRHRGQGDGRSRPRSPTRASPRPRCWPRADPTPGRWDAFMVMNLAEGQPLLAGLEVSGPRELPSLARRLPATLATVLAASTGSTRRSSTALDARGRTPGVAHDARSRLRTRRSALGPGRPRRCRPMARGPSARRKRSWCATATCTRSTSSSTDGAPRRCWTGPPPCWRPPPTTSGSRRSWWARRAPRRAPSPAPGRRARVGPCLAASSGLERSRPRQPIDARSLAWHQGVVCLRALVEVAGWVAAGTTDDRAGHPWVIAGPAFAARLGPDGTVGGLVERLARASRSARWVSYMRAMTPDGPDGGDRWRRASARTPARRAPTAKPPSRQSR